MDRLMIVIEKEINAVWGVGRGGGEELYPPFQQPPHGPQLQ